MNTPSPAALRAADAVIARIAKPWTPTALAQIIDAEFAPDRAELIEALRAIVNSAVRHRWKVNSDEPDTINAAMDILAKYFNT
jgi:hypothetical protein